MCAGNRKSHRSLLRWWLLFLRICNELHASTTGWAANHHAGESDRFHQERVSDNSDEIGA
jgi:hypothetical protein